MARLTADEFDAMERLREARDVERLALIREAVELQRAATRENRTQLLLFSLQVLALLAIAAAVLFHR